MKRLLLLAGLWGMAGLATAQEQARVISSTPIVQQVAVPQQVCQDQTIATAPRTTGGGAVLRPENRQRLHERCRVIYLKSSPEELHRRLRHDTSRPLLQVADPLGRLRQLFNERDPLYREVAHFTVETGRPSVAALVNMILMQLELAGEIDPSLARSPVDPSPNPD